MRLLLVPALFALSTACVDVPDDEAALELDEATSELGIGPTVLTFYQHASLTGTTYSVSLSSPDVNERTKLISKPDIEAAGLLGRTSAVRLKCGSRDARVVLFDSHNMSNTSFSAWNHLGGDGGTVSCVSGQTVTINLHDRFPGVADQVASAFLVTHATAPGRINFTDYFESAWGVAMDNLPSAATPTRTDIWLSTTRQFRIRQFLDIDHWACTERGAVFEYRVTLDSDGTFSAIVTDSYVDYGFGDLWDCRNKMQATLDSSLAGARVDLEAGLDELVGFLAPDHTRYYFVPNVRLTAFDLFYGADPVEGPVNHL
ncbi:MAG: hypothetical protein H0V17_35245 [Deltaproteobacteria bacterium]|nr:hypothetical protein [Deltaproteobacteria bacterium]